MTDAVRRAWAARMSEAAHGLLDGLDAAQRHAACHPFPADEERRRWFYTPTDHGGLPLHAMDPAQHRLVHRLLATGLSTPGYVTTVTIMGLENVLDHVEGFRSEMDRPRGRDPLAYWIALFGLPGDDAWSWRFGGHHVSLHFTIVDGEVAGATPLFLGADPAASPLLGPHLHRPLAGAEDLGRELIHSLDQEQRTVAVVSPVAPPDLVGANRSVLADGDQVLPLVDVWRGRLEGSLADLMAGADERLRRDLGYTDAHHQALTWTDRPKGLSAAALTSDQRELLRALVRVYVDRLPDDVADAELARVEAELDAVHVLWAGSIERGEPHYYRLQGSSVVIEYDNAARGANHIHTVWRDLVRDFGDPLAQHYTEPGHH